MAKLRKIVSNTSLVLMEVLTILLIFLAFAIRTSTFQSFLAHKGARYLSEYLDTKVNIGKVDIVFLDRLYFDELYIEDQHQDTLFYIHEFYLHFNLREAFQLKFEAKNVKITEGKASLKKYKNEEKLNLQFIVDAFDSDKEKKEIDFQLLVHNVEIYESYFSFVDENKEKNAHSVDFTNLEIKNLELLANNVLIQPKNYEAEIQKVALKEKSGLELEKLAGSAKFNDKGLRMTQAQIKTSHSDIFLDSFHLVSSQIQDFSDFENLIQIQSKINPSSVSFLDISLFAPALKGMNDVVTISGSTEEAINNLTLKNIQINYGQNTEIKGNFRLLDFKNITAENLQQNFDYLFIDFEDLEQFTLPETATERHIKIPKALQAITQLESKNIHISGNMNDLTLKLTELNTPIGKISFDEEFRVLSDSTFNTLKIIPKNGMKNQIKIQNLQLANVIKTRDVGKLNGYLGVNSFVIDNKKIQTNQISGVLNSTRIYNYSYDYIVFDNFNYTITKNKRKDQHTVNGNLFINDENFDFGFSGMASIGDSSIVNASFSIDCAQLDALDPVFENRGELITKMEVEIKAKDIDNFEGILHTVFVNYAENNKIYSTDNFNGFIKRSPSKDSISIQSDIAEGVIFGNIDYSKVIPNITNQIASVFPMFVPKKDAAEDKDSYFDYVLIFKDINNLLSVVYPSMKISRLAKVSGKYSGIENELRMNVDAESFTFNNLQFKEIFSKQIISEQELSILIDVDKFNFRDSTTYKGIHLTGLASNGNLDSQIQFFDNNNNLSNIEWFTDLTDDLGFEIFLYPSTISFYGNNWELKQNATISYHDDCLVIDNFKLENNEQYFIADGSISDSPHDRLYLDIKNFDLKNMGRILHPTAEFSGIVNVTGFATSPTTNFQFNGEAIIDNFYINETEVGSVGFGAYYSAKEERIKMTGELFYHDLRTFHFDGFYGVIDETGEPGKLDFKMHFKQTEIAAVKEFIDPQLINHLNGKIDGKFNLTGTINEPILSGKAKIKEGIFNLAILGADFYIDGEFEVTKDSVIVHRLPIKDKEGNTGYISGEVTHHNFIDFKYAIDVNLQEHPTKRMTNDSLTPLPVERFMVMNTTYDIDKLYYGDAYITGLANIRGTNEDLSIYVKAKTKKGTKFVLPMYGPTTIEEDGFITFKKQEESEDAQKGVNLTGIDFRMEIEATDDAEAKLIFDEKIGDEISARGNGILNLSVDRFGALNMDGTYTVSQGVYNFAMGPYKQVFNISPESTVQWAGNPYEAILNINAYYKTIANLSTVMPDVVENQSSNNEEILSYLYIRGNMMSPEISFDLDAPKANEAGKAIISRIKSDPDELNRQFFSIIISKSFIPLSGAMVAGATSGAFLDLASTQLSNMLNKMADGYNMNVNLESDDFSGQFSGEFGVSKSFLDDRLFISGSFGMGTKKSETGGGQENIPNQNTFIGDVKIEYLLNEKGTFRMNVFNESNNNFILQNEGRGQFTQGVGVSYTEDFHNFGDFKLYQFFANVFRKKKSRVKVRRDKNNEIPIPEEFLNKNIINEE